jgi:hypothetical protein
MKAAKKITNIKKTIFISSLLAATRPALNNKESPGRKKPTSNPVSIKIITPITR